MLKNSANKAQLNTPICEQILIEEDYLQNVTQDHRLVVTGDKAVPTQVYIGSRRGVLWPIYI